MEIVEYKPEYESSVIELWEKCELTRPWNNPWLDIERKMKDKPELFLMGLIDGRVVASAMGGYEGHRGLGLLPGRRPGAAATGAGETDDECH